MNKKLAIVVLAAGLGKRMKNPQKPKVMFELCGKPMIDYVIELAVNLNPERIIIVVGHHKEQVKNHLDDKYKNKIEYAYQSQQLGTGHAVIQAKELLNSFEGDVLILSGDVPLLKKKTIENLIKEHSDSNQYATLLTTTVEDAKSYGRIICDASGNFLKIVEDKDASTEEKKINEINPAIYLINSKILLEALGKIKSDNKQNEYYLTDIFHFIPRDKIGLIKTYDELEVTGINSLEQLLEVETLLADR